MDVSRLWKEVAPMMTQHSLTDLWALGERAIAAIYDENSGSIFHRINVVRGRAMEAVFARVLED